MVAPRSGIAPTISQQMRRGYRHSDARCFQIRPKDPRTISARRVTNHELIGRGYNKEQAIRRVDAALQQARSSSLARGTKITHKSQLAYWAEFCSLFDFEEQDFGRLAPGEIHPSLEKLREEEEVLASFMAFVIACPRKGREQNTANYALQCISAVRSHYALLNGRRPGLREGGKTGGQLRVVIRGFQKTNPAQKEARLPILQQHLRAIKQFLDLQNNQYHKTLWALWLTQWQGVLRSSDLIKYKRDARRPWIPDQETHRGRISVDVARDLNGRALGPRIKILLKPNKTDQNGEKRTIKSFIIDETPGALSAGQAIREMLRADPHDDGLTMTPLFRDPNTTREITYEESYAALLTYLRRAGYTQETIGTHSLRIGEATAYANATNGGYAVSGFMGLWASSSKDWYLHACTPRIDMAALEIGRATTWELAEKPGPVARYAR